MRKHLIAQGEKKTEEQLEELVERARRGDLKAWKRLWGAVEPVVDSVARRVRLTGRLARCRDARRDVVLRVMEGLCADGCRRLGELGERLACRDGSWRAWLVKIAEDAAVDCVRAHPDFLGRTARSWADLVPVAEPVPEETCDERAPDSRLLQARLILARCPELLEPAQDEALCLWLRGDDFEEIAAAVEGCADAEAAARLVHSALKRLRLRFAPSAAGRGLPTAPEGEPHARVRAGGSARRPARGPGSKKIDRPG